MDIQGKQWPLVAGLINTISKCPEKWNLHVHTIDFNTCKGPESRVSFQKKYKCLKSERDTC